MSFSLNPFKYISKGISKIPGVGDALSTVFDFGKYLIPGVGQMALLGDAAGAAGDFAQGNWKGGIGQGLSAALGYAGGTKLPGMGSGGETVNGVQQYWDKSGGIMDFLKPGGKNSLADYLKAYAPLVSSLGGIASGRTGAETDQIKAMAESAETQNRYLLQQMGFADETAQRQRSVDPVMAQILQRLQQRTSGAMPWGSEGVLQKYRGGGVNG